VCTVDTPDLPDLILLQNQKPQADIYITKHKNTFFNTQEKASFPCQPPNPLQGEFVHVFFPLLFFPEVLVLAVFSSSFSLF
ncbi:hypothetical protein PL639_23780, partial [Phocaeicola vulgatus]|uniref:hypothetical protein n=1 Tax=Bacteroides fragilis TaxID=817 RepID=UPI002307C3FD|nr:hypothetical protein [Phocaeicola vulgatus]